MEIMFRMFVRRGRKECAMLTRRCFVVVFQEVPSIRVAGHSNLFILDIELISYPHFSQSHKACAIHTIGLTFTLTCQDNDNNIRQPQTHAHIQCTVHTRYPMKSRPSPHSETIYYVTWF